MEEGLREGGERRKGMGRRQSKWIKQNESFNEGGSERRLGEVKGDGKASKQWVHAEREFQFRRV